MRTVKKYIWALDEIKSWLERKENIILDRIELKKDFIVGFKNQK